MRLVRCDAGLDDVAPRNCFFTFPSVSLACSRLRAMVSFEKNCHRIPGQSNRETETGKLKQGQTVWAICSL